MKLFCIFLAILPLFVGAIDWVSLSCRDENKYSVDWFINYKLPKHVGGEGELKGSSGKEYAYLVSGCPATTAWMLSNRSITAHNSMLGLTLRYFYGNLPTTKTYSYLFYNDELPEGMPEDTNEEVGHTKGVVIFDLKQGFWLIHSIPKFPPKDHYRYPENALDFGQSILCITFGINSLNAIGKQLLINHPHIYSYHLSSDLEVPLNNDVKSLFSKHPKFITGKPTYSVVSFMTKRQQMVTSFAKNAAYHKDLYSDLMAPSLGASLFAETWRREPEDILPPACYNKFKVLDVKAIAMNVQNATKKRSFYFKSNCDNSKWAISQDQNLSFVCIGDINRMKSHEKRGGGSVCVSFGEFVEVWKLFKGIIKGTNSCQKVDVNHEL